jgi:LysM repeat protein
MSYRRMLPFLLINIIVSATVVLAILWWWDGRNEEPQEPLAAVPEVPQVDIPQVETPAAERAPVELSAEPAAPIPDEAGPNVHVVVAGETLGQISSRYDISMDEIMDANNMANANLLFVGQELIIPLAGIPVEEVEEAPETTNTDPQGALPTPIPTAPSTAGEALIEIAEVVGPGQLPLEAVQIVNNGSRETNLSEWKLADQFGNYYEFRAITLFGDGAGIMIHTTQGQDNATDLYWGEEESLWTSGDMVILYDADGTVIAEYQVP